jgi:hypothetical protein
VSIFTTLHAARCRDLVCEVVPQPGVDALDGGLAGIEIRQRQLQFQYPSVLSVTGLRMGLAWAGRSKTVELIRKVPSEVDARASGL